MCGVYMGGGVYVYMLQGWGQVEYLYLVLVLGTCT